MANLIPQDQPAGSSSFRLRKLILSLQGKLILPYVVLTLVLAMIGTFIITRLVTSTFRERFVNQLYQSSRAVADSLARRERVHLENLRLMAFTEGVAPALASRDADRLQTLLSPLALNSKVELVTAVDLAGQEVLTLAFVPSSAQYVRSQGQDFAAFLPVQNVLNGVVDEKGDKFVGLLESAQGLALFTSAPVVDSSGDLVGVLLVGTHLPTLLAEAKSEAMADVALLDGEGHLLATTLAQPQEGFAALEEVASQADLAKANTYDFQFSDRRQYQAVFAPWEVRKQTLGLMGVVLPSNYLVSTEVTSRNTFSIVFTLGTMAVILVGYWLSQNIARPILRLRSMSQAVAAGDLNQQIGLRRADEIGELADAFDVMTDHLRLRTAETERLYSESIQRNKELAEINARLQDTQQQLVQSEKLAAVGQLTAGIVHDVKNPLMVIKGMAELLAEDNSLPETARKDLKVIREGAVNASRIVTDLLKFARQAAPEMKLQDLRETVEAALRLTAYLSKSARIQVASNLPEGMVLAQYDAQQIEQVLINLIQNAIQATPEGGEIHVSLRQNNGMVAVIVQDTGCGIPPENLKRIFDPFFTTKPPGQGTGLGLSVSYGIIANHQGYIDVESQIGTGTTFTVWLPAHSAKPEEA